MHAARAFKVHEFGSSDPLEELLGLRQVQYLRCYLHDLNVRWILEEPNYFDRDYLAEFAAFYSTSARGYSNICRRLTFFTACDCTTRGGFKRTLRSALGRSETAAKKLSKGLKGFVVLRPTEKAPLARTVLEWYPDRPQEPARVTCQREYRIHIAGQQFMIRGLAWQQQDAGVSACATIALWTMLHAQAFDERLSIPTTVEVTRSAHRTASLGSRVFPSDGLISEQILEAIKEQGLSPNVFEGDVEHPTTREKFGFSRERFSATVAAMLRSGYPVLILGDRGEGHAVCAVGFRPARAPAIAPGQVAIEDDSIQYLYVHDDNLGPSVRFRVEESDGRVCLVPDAPEPRNTPRLVDDPTDQVEPLCPLSMIIATHEDVRVTPDEVHSVAFKVAQPMSLLAQAVAQHAGLDWPGLSLGVRYMRLSHYLGVELPRVIVQSRVLGRVRLVLCEKVRPMSRHVAIARVGKDGDPLLDVLYDTTDSKPNLAAFANLAFEPESRRLVDVLTRIHWRTDAVGLLGRHVDAF